MNASTERQFHFHADASPVGGHITHPFEQIITTEASSSLAQAGGLVTGVHESYRLDPIVSAQKAYSHISGAKNQNTGNWTTLTTSVVEFLNVLEVVTADRIVARIAVEHPKVGYTPRVSFVVSVGTWIRTVSLACRGEVFVCHTTAPAGEYSENR